MQDSQRKSPQRIFVSKQMSDESSRIKSAFSIRTTACFINSLWSRFTSFSGFSLKVTEEKTWLNNRWTLLDSEENNWKDQAKY